MSFWISATAYGTHRVFILAPLKEVRDFMDSISCWGKPDKTWRDSDWLKENVISWEIPSHQVGAVESYLITRFWVRDPNIVRN